MSLLPKALSRLIESFEKLPGIGPKTAQRLAFYLLHVPQDDLDSFAGNLSGLKSQTVLCSLCKNVAEAGPCSICSNPTRATMEGEATAMYIQKQIHSLITHNSPASLREVGRALRITRLAHGLPVGADIEYADEVTLSRALEGRREF